jgi:hypothetical protein
MTNGRNKRPDQSGQPAPGRVVIDNRGHNVWQWDDNQLDSTTVMLQQLDAAALTLEPTRTTRKLKLDERLRHAAEEPAPAVAAADADDDSLGLALEATFCFKPGSGFDPYNRS